MHNPLLKEGNLKLHERNQETVKCSAQRQRGNLGPSGSEGNEPAQTQGVCV